LRADFFSEIIHPHFFIDKKYFATPKTEQAHNFRDQYKHKAGLSISYDIIVQEHDGKMFFVTEERKFTRFIVRLPKYPPEN